MPGNPEKFNKRTPGWRNEKTGGICGEIFVRHFSGKASARARICVSTGQTNHYRLNYLINEGFQPDFDPHGRLQFQLFLLLQSEKSGPYGWRSSQRCSVFFYPFLKKQFYLNFYGGEPFLQYHLIQDTVGILSEKNRLTKKKGQFSITTNGSLLTEDRLPFLAKNRFAIELSFDGFVQNIGRKKESFKKTVSLIQKIHDFPGIRLETNSVFTPETIAFLSRSMEYIVGLGVSSVRFSLSYLNPWNENAIKTLHQEMIKLRFFLTRHFEQTHTIPVYNFIPKKKKGFFFCSAGTDRITITTDGHIWGCHLFSDYYYREKKTSGYEKFHFGHFETFKSNWQNTFPQIKSQYKKLSMDEYKADKRECFLCPDIQWCQVCPVNAAFSSGSIGTISEFFCRLQQLKIRQKKLFWNFLEKEESSAFQNPDQPDS